MSREAVLAAMWISHSFASACASAALAFNGHPWIAAGVFLSAFFLRFSIRNEPKS